MKTNTNWSASGLWILLAIIVFIVVTIVIAWLTTINSWEIWVVYKYWAISWTIWEWISFNNPFTTDIKIIDIKTKKLEVIASSASKDLQSIQGTIALNYSVNKVKVETLLREIWTSYEVNIIQPTLQEVVKSATAKFTAEELVTKRNEVKDLMQKSITEKLTNKGFIVTDLNIVNFEFSKSFNEAIENKVQAEQNSLAQKNKLEQVKYEAQQQIEKAKAEAESIKIQAQAVTSQWWADYVKLKWIEKWNWQEPTTVLWENSSTLINLQK